MEFRRLALFLAVLLVLAVPVTAVLPDAQTKIFAVTNDGKGLVATLDLRVEPGTGQIYSGVDSLVGTSTQNAYKTALDVARNYSDKVDQYNYYFDIKSSASIVDGPSAGAATTLLLVTSLRDQQVPANVGMTGTISENGSVGTVGGVFEKAQAASQDGIKLFMIPKGEAKQITRTANGIESVNLVEYAPKTWGMKVVEVDNLDQALQFAFSNISEIDVNQQIEQSRSIFVPAPVTFNPELEPLHAITKTYLDNAAQQIQQAKASLNNTILADQQLVDLMFESLTESENVLDEAKTLYDQNFLYSAANSAFTATVNANLVRDISTDPSILQENSTAFQTKLQELDLQLAVLKKRLDVGVAVDKVDWQIAAQQRWLWARSNLDNLQNTQTIVIPTNGQAPSVSDVQLERLRNYEFAVAWKDVADDFSQELQKATKQIKNMDGFKAVADRQLIEAENQMPLVAQDDRLDIERRFDGAKTAQSLNWYLSMTADAASVTSLVQAQTQSQGKSLSELEVILDQKISELDKNLSANRPYVWARIYLDHARYFRQALQYYKDQNHTQEAMDAAISGVSIVFLAEGAFESQQKIYDFIDQSSPTPYQSAPFVPLPGPTANTPTLILIGAVIVLAGVIIVLVFLYMRKGSSREKTETVLPSSYPAHAVKTFLRETAELDRQFAQGKIDADTYHARRDRFLREMVASKEQSGALQNQLPELGTSIKSLEKEFEELKQQSKRGDVSPQEFSQRVESIQAQLQENKSKLESEKGRVLAASKIKTVPASAPLAPKTVRSDALEDLVREIKKEPAKKNKPNPAKKNKK